MCKYCDGACSQEALYFDKKYGQISLEINKTDLTIWNDNVCMAGFKIRYCPFCGAVIPEVPYNEKILNKINALTEKREQTVYFVDELPLDIVTQYLDEFVRRVAFLIKSGDVDPKRLCRTEFTFALENETLIDTIKNKEKNDE